MTVNTAPRVVFVTGAAMGNGQAITSRFLASGDVVVALDINAAALTQARESTWGKYDDDRLMCLTADIADAPQPLQAIKSTLSRFDRLDVLVNNAGITGGPEAGQLHSTSIADFDRVMALNVRAMFICCQITLPHMLAQGGGKIINIASVAGQVAFPGRAAYSISKGAVIQLTKSIAVDYGRLGINCNAVCPGFIETPMTQWRLDQPELKAALLAQIPQNEIGTAAQVAEAVWFLASPEAQYFNGSSLTMDGGYTAH